MTNILSIIVILFSLAAIPHPPSSVRHSFGQTTATTPKKISVGNLKNGDAVEGCGCYFTFPANDKKNNSRFAFMADPEKTAWMNIDGKDVKLTLGRYTEPKGREKVGDKSVRTYTAPGIDVTATFIATWVCGRKDENCEVTKY